MNDLVHLNILVFKALIHKLNQYNILGKRGCQTYRDECNARPKQFTETD